MALYTEQQLRSLGHEFEVTARSSAAILKEADSTLAKRISRFDVFLSHSFKDATVILGIKRILEKQNLTVYVDWIDDPNS